MKARILVFFILAALFASLGCEVPEPVVRDTDQAPSWESTLAGGEAINSTELLENGPYILYFVKIGCPINEPLVQYFNEVGSAYEGVQFYGVIDGNQAEFERWNRSHSVDFPMILDPDMRLIRSFDAEASPWVVVVDENGGFGRIDPGTSQSRLMSLNEFSARTAQVPMKKIDFSGVSERDTFGCRF